MTTEERGSQGDEFVKSLWSTGQIIMEQTEQVVEGIMDPPPESQPAFGVLVAQSILHVTEETPDTRNGKSHGPYFTEKNLLPSFHRCPLLLRQRNLSENVG
jgi:hypothetical protein